MSKIYSFRVNFTSADTDPANATALAARMYNFYQSVRQAAGGESLQGTGLPLPAMPAGFVSGYLLLSIKMAGTELEYSHSAYFSNGRCLSTRFWSANSAGGSQASGRVEMVDGLPLPVANNGVLKLYTKIQATLVNRRSTVNSIANGGFCKVFFYQDTEQSAWDSGYGEFKGLLYLPHDYSGTTYADQTMLFVGADAYFVCAPYAFKCAKTGFVVWEG